MPTVAVNLADVQAFESLPEGSYYAEIAKITYREASAAGKFPQMMASYLVIDGDHVGRTQSEFLSFSPKALFRMKRWFNKFGLGDIPELDFDDETSELNDPDLYGSRVIFAVTKDRRDATRFNTDLVSVEEEAEPAPAPKPAARPAAPARPTRPVAAAAPEPEVEAVEDEPAEAVETVEAEAEVEEEAPAPARRPAAPARAGRAAPAPQRRTLR